MIYNYVKVKAEDANGRSFEKLTLLDDSFMKIRAKGRTIEELKEYLRKISAMFKEQDYKYMTDENDWHEDYYVPPEEMYAGKWTMEEDLLFSNLKPNGETGLQRIEQIQFLQVEIIEDFI